jgi:Tfp pilus assembly protein PilO
MRPLFGRGAEVPLARVLSEHRAALVPLAIVLAVNIIVLVAVVLPLSGRVTANEARAEQAARAQVLGAAESKQAEGQREAKARAAADLEKFYRQVLPADLSTARRLTQLKFQQLAREHNVRFQRGSAEEEQPRASTLRRLTVSMTLAGDYDDIRAFIYDLERSPDFVVIENLALSEGETSSEALAMEMEVSTYFQVLSPPGESATPNGR